MIWLKWNLMVGMFVFSTNATACTFIQLGSAKNRVSAQNFDFLTGTTLSLVVNKRNVQKTGEVFDGASGKPVSWIAKYGSVTFGFGREQGIGGVNEMGLSAHRLVLTDTQYPAANGSPQIQENFWLAYILDTSATIYEAIQHAKMVQIYSPYHYPTHFAFCDAKADCAMFEFLKGELRITSGLQLKSPVLTNEDYSSDMNELEKCPTGNCESLQGVNNNSKWRFVNAALQVKAYSGSDPVAATWKILDFVKQNGATGVATLWSYLVHQSASGIKLMIKNTASSEIVANVDLSKLDFSCSTPVQVAAFGANDTSAPRGFSDYSLAFQKPIANQMRFFGVSPADLERMIKFPEANEICLDHVTQNVKIKNHQTVSLK